MTPSKQRRNIISKTLNSISSSLQTVQVSNICCDGNNKSIVKPQF